MKRAILALWNLHILAVRGERVKHKLKQQSSPCRATNPDHCRSCKTGIHKAKRPISSRATSNSSVSSSEAMLSEALILLNRGEMVLFESAVRKIVKSPSAKNLAILKVASNEDVRSLLTNLHDQITSSLGHYPDLSTNKNNRIGSDFEDSVSGTSIEVKFGASTDLNIGFRIISSILPKEITYLLPTSGDREKWRNLQLNGQGNQQIIEHSEKLKNVSSSLSEQISKGHSLLVEQNHFLNSLYYGINNFSEINAMRSQDINDRRQIILLKITSDLQWEQTFRPSLTVNQGWKIDKTEFTDKGRWNIFFVHEDGHIIRLTYNYKNSYRLSNGVKVSAKHGLGTPSFNGWIKIQQPKTQPETRKLQTFP